MKTAEQTKRALKKATQAMRVRILTDVPISPAGGVQLQSFALDFLGAQINGAEKFRPILKDRIQSAMDKLYPIKDEAIREFICWGNALIQYPYYTYTVHFHINF